MKDITLNFKEFNVNLDKVQAEAKALAPDMVHGMSADINIRIHCKDEITDEQVAAIEAYFEAIEEESEEVESYRTSEEIQEAIKTLKNGLLAKSWNDMSAIERGLVVGQEPTAAQLIAANLI